MSDAASVENTERRRALALATCSAVWVIVQRDNIDWIERTLIPAYSTKNACITRLIRLREREEDSYSYGYRRIPVVGKPNNALGATQLSNTRAP